MTDKKPLNLREYWDTVGTENVKQIVFAIGSSMAYARLIKYGLKKPGPDFSLRFIETAREITPGFAPDLELMLRGVPRNANSRGKTIPPSPEFLAAQAARQGIRA
jgi:hypothetical protein